MVDGLDRFKEQFSQFEGMYTLIGGVACGLLMDEAGLDFRTTKDFDVVLIIEALTEEFGKAFWQFVKDGDYEIKERSNGEPEFYRFKNPKDTTYPKQIELFSRRNNVLKYNADDNITAIHISEEISSLSAILLNDEYYELLKSGLRIVDDIQVLNYTHIIPFKAKAWLDLKARRENGEQVDSSNIKKHKNDVFRLAQLVAETDKVIISEAVKADMAMFINAMRKENFVLKDIGVSGKKDDTLSILENVYLGGK